jgi:eukaryotic-like serine/threonine-protein kinase
MSPGASYGSISRPSGLLIHLATRQIETQSALGRVCCALVVLRFCTSGYAAAMDREGWEFEQGDPIVPQRLALTPLGGGERYDTWLAWDEAMFAVVVAKVLRPAYLDSRSRRELAREAELALTLRHPIIVRGFDAVLDGPRPHLVLEHLEGPTMRSALRRLRHGAGGRMTLEQVLPLGLHLCSALHFLGAQGVVHLDIKPSNIVMGPVPRLIDLSAARPVERAAALRTVVGTRQYMAPEQADPCPSRRGEIGGPADIWAVGACLYEALTGCRPYRAIDGDENTTPQVDAPPPEWPRRAEVPPALQEAVSGCLTQSPSERPTPDELAAALEPMVAALPTLRPKGRRGLRY